MNVHFAILAIYVLDNFANDCIVCVHMILIDCDSKLNRVLVADLELQLLYSKCSSTRYLFYIITGPYYHM
jgi:hypothetical protein